MCPASGPHLVPKAAEHLAGQEKDAVLNLNPWCMRCTDARFKCSSWHRPGVCPASSPHLVPKAAKHLARQEKDAVLVLSVHTMSGG